MKKFVIYTVTERKRKIIEQESDIDSVAQKIISEHPYLEIEGKGNILWLRDSRDADNSLKVIITEMSD